MRPLRVAVIGTGYFSQYHYEAWSRIPGARVEALCFRSDRAKARALADHYAVDRIYDDPVRMLDEVAPDVLDIVSPPETHLPLVELAAPRRIPIISQKPLAPTVAEAERLVMVAEEVGTLLVVHENWRFKPWIRELKRLIQAGAIGEVFSIAFRMRPGDGQGPDAYLARQPYFQRMPRFLIHETGIHAIDVFRYLLGEVAAVYARLRRLNPVIKGEDAGFVLFEFADGPEGVFDGNRLADFVASDPRLTMGDLLIDGAEGRLRLDGEARIWIKPRRADEVEHAYAWVDRGYGGDCVHALQRHVVEHLRENAPIENSGRDYLRNLMIEDAIYRSSDDGRRIELGAA